MIKTTKKDASKITTENKATQTAQEEKVKIEAEDLTSGMFEIFFSLFFSVYCAYFSCRLQKYNERQFIKVFILYDSDNPSDNYLQVLAERRRMVLLDTLEENKKLYQRIEKLEEENRIYKEMLDETKTLIEVLQVMLSTYCTDIILNISYYSKCSVLYILLQEEIDDRNDINNSLDDSTL